MIAAASRQGERSHSSVVQTDGASADFLVPVFGALVASMMFDFRAAADSGAGVALVIFAGIYAIAFTIFFVIDSGFRYPAPGLSSISVAGGVFLIVAIVSGLDNGQTLNDLARLSVPMLLYLTITYASARVVMAGDPSKVRRMLAFIALIYGIACVFVQQLITGEIDLNTVRYQILSGATIPSIGYLACMALFGIGVVEVCAIGLVFVLLFLSVTRTYLLSALSQLAPLAAGAQRLIGPRLVMIVAIAAFFFAGFVAYGGESINRWTDRVFNQRTSSGEDYTLYTRQSEWDYMIKSWTSTTRTIMFGSGIAARTVWYNPKETGGGSEYSIGFGHSQHLSLLFIAGLIGGGTLLAVQFWQFFQSIALLARLARSNFERSDTLFLAAWGATIIIGVIVATFFSSILNNRSWALWYGVGTGLFVGGRARYLRECGVGLVTGAMSDGLDETGKAPNTYVLPAVSRRRAALAQSEQAAGT